MVFRIFWTALAAAVGCLAQPDVSAFVPASAKLIKQLEVDFDHNGDPATVIAYASETTPVISTGIRVLKHAPSGWAVVLEEPDDVTNGAGASAAIDINILGASHRKQGVLVTLHFSGAGTATMWYVLASLGNKISKIEPTRLRAKVLKQRGYQDWGYNGVTAKGKFVIETQAGYSRNTARCCPDRPTIEMFFRFTGSSIMLVSVQELPFRLSKY